MSAPDRKVVLVTRRTRLDELLARFHTLGQAKFYLEHLGADFSDYVREDAAYARAKTEVSHALQAWGRHQVIDRDYLPNFVFAADDIVVALGQDGLVANTLKYLHGQPLVGINPEPSRWDGLLLPFLPTELKPLLADVAAERRPVTSVTMAQATLSDGQTLLAVNDLFIGPRTHTSALYDIRLGDHAEAQSSSGLVVSTGLGSSAWLKSIVTGSLGIAAALQPEAVGAAGAYRPMPWDTDHLAFAVREPFASRTSSAQLVYGEVTADQPLKLRSRMPDHGVIFSDGIEADYLRFTAGMEATIGLAATRGRLVR